MVYFTSRKLRALVLIFGLVSFATFLLRESLFLPSPFQDIANKKCRCRYCIWDAEAEDTWFNERFNQSIHPLLSTSNSELSDDTYKWWLVSTLHSDHTFVVFLALGQVFCLKCVQRDFCTGGMRPSHPYVFLCQTKLQEDMVEG